MNSSQDEIQDQCGEGNEDVVVVTQSVDDRNEG